MAQVPYNAPVGLAYAHISNAGTTVVKAAAGLLPCLNINSGSTGATLTLFDQATTVTGTVEIGVITLGTSDILPLSYPYAPPNGINFKNGLVIVSTGTIDVTVPFR